MNEPVAPSVLSGVLSSKYEPVAPSGVPTSVFTAPSVMTTSEPVEHDVEFEFDDHEMDSPREALEDAAVIWLQQIGGHRIKFTIQHGWLDTITGEDMYNPSKNLQRHWLTSDMVSFFGHRYAQPIPFQRLRILESQAYSTIVERKNVKAWERATRGVAVVCLPVCNNSHWTLIIVLLTSTTPRVFHLDSLNVKGKVRPVAKAVGKLLSVSAKPISVPIQQNGNDCGVHVVSHMMTLMRLMNKVNDNDLATYMEPLQFSTVLTRDDLKCDLVNAVEEAMCEHSYWAQCQLDDGEWMWWPCRRFSHGFGARLGVQLQEDGVLVVWYCREVNDMMCIPRNRICPLKYLTVEDACLLCTYEDDEKVMLQEAYRQASL
ncbi:uncharacterized protein KRP23_1894 [Phytophthora ramorum]|uniref:uncharacterized protein n=1 Tax=Phytophthora ramorum TaxID=164328 RepID=UPI0030B08133|nr:hypothetical protein KRP23_1894 [Phytophthora ramorum]